MAPQNKKKAPGATGKPAGKPAGKPKYNEYVVKEPAELMDFLMSSMAGISRTTAKSLLSHRQVMVNNQVTTLYNFSLKPGMVVRVSKEKGRKEFTNRYVKIIYEDAYVLVVEKKAGILSVTPTGKKENSVLTILNEYIKRSGKQRRVFHIHQLDKEASGLILFAKDEKIKYTFQDYWKDLVKEYRFLAVVNGEMEKNAGVISSWMNEGQVYVSHSGINKSNFDHTTTHYKKIRSENGYSLVELHPEASSRNQIRFHMHELKNPVVGDLKYNSDTDPLERLALHAFKIVFTHPVTHKKLEFEINHLSEFKKLLAPVKKEDSYEE